MTPTQRAEALIHLMSIDLQFVNLIANEIGVAERRALLAERERCAKVADGLHVAGTEYDADVGAAIRSTDTRG